MEKETIGCLPTEIAKCAARRVSFSSGVIVPRPFSRETHLRACSSTLLELLRKTKGRNICRGPADGRPRSLRFPRAASGHFENLSDRRRRPSQSRRAWSRSEEHTSELQSRLHLVCRLLLEKKKITDNTITTDNNN